MSLASGSRLGPYEILAPLGAGGMGEVWRARDTRLGREVAVKVVHAQAAGDAERRKRFEQEARTAASIQHPNLLALYDVGVHDGQPFLVTELLSGRTLREVLVAGEKIPVRRALDWGAQAARGLAAAHERGIVHRDLKPENLFLTADGTLKILDFGLAKLTAPDGDSLAAAATIAGTDTASGVILGTAGYMAPEQVRGEKVDARADLFALGCVLYELLGGRRAFEGESAIDTLHAILRDEPSPLLEQRPEVPAAVARVVDSCLAKSAAQRFQSARDLALALDALSASSGASSATRVPAPLEPRRPAIPRWLPVLGAGVLALAAGFFAGRASKSAQLQEPTRLRPLTYSGRDQTPASSPDGRTIAFASDRDGRFRIWIKQLGSGGEAPVTEGPDNNPRFFPDGQSILFTRLEGGRRALYRTALVGGSPRKLVDDADQGDISPDGERMAFVRTPHEGEASRSTIFVARADGSDVRELVRSEAGEMIIYPRFSPDGRTIAFSRTGQAGTRGEVRLVSLEGKPLSTVEAPLGNAAITAVAWDPRGRSLFFVQAVSSLGGAISSEGRLVRHDLADGRTSLLFWTPVNGSTLAISGDRIVFDGMLPRENLRVIPLAAGAAPAGARWLTRGYTADRQPAPTPDGGSVIFSSSRSGNQEIWSASLATGAATPLTDDPADDWDAEITPDGRHLLWSSNRSGTFEIWIADADGSHPRQVTHDGDAENPTATPDGAWIVYASGTRENTGIWKIRADGSGATRLASGYLLNPELSPDGAYVAYRRLTLGEARARVQVIRTADGVAVPFEIQAQDNGWGQAGRVRWTNGGRALAFVAAIDSGAQGIFVQDFVPGTDTQTSRRRIDEATPDAWPESFGLTSDGSLLVAANVERSSNLMIAEPVPGLAATR